MARIPEEEIERLKNEVSLERLAEARGVQLTAPTSSGCVRSTTIASLRRSSRRRRICGIAWARARPAAR